MHMSSSSAAAAAAGVLVLKGGVVRQRPFLTSISAGLLLGFFLGLRARLLAGRYLRSLIRHLYRRYGCDDPRIQSGCRAQTSPTTDIDDPSSQPKATEPVAAAAADRTHCGTPVARLEAAQAAGPGLMPGSGTPLRGSATAFCSRGTAAAAGMMPREWQLLEYGWAQLPGAKNEDVFAARRGGGDGGGGGGGSTVATGPVECVGVFDGHRGSAVAAHVAEALPLRLEAVRRTQLEASPGCSQLCIASVRLLLRCDRLMVWDCVGVGGDLWPSQPRQCSRGAVRRV
jgi:hypothetical protein